VQKGGPTEKMQEFYNNPAVPTLNVDTSQPVEQEKVLALWPDVIAYIFAGIGLSCLINTSIETRDLDQSLTWGAVGFAALWGFTGFRHGLFNEIVLLARLAVPAFLTWQFGSEVGSLLGMPNFIGLAVGSPLVFMLSYFIVGRVFRQHILKPQVPTIPGQILGLFAGIAEAGVVIAITGFALSYVPPGNFKMESSLTAELGRAVEQSVVKPMLASVATGPATLLPLLADKKFIEKAPNMDWRSIELELSTIGEHPKIQSLLEDKELEELVKNKKFTEYVKHPKIRGMLTDPELGKIAENIDWQKIHNAIELGMRQQKLPQTPQSNHHQQQCPFQTQQPGDSQQPIPAQTPDAAPFQMPETTP